MSENDAMIMLKLTEMRMSDKMDDAFLWMYTQYKADSYEEFKQKYPLLIFGILEILLDFYHLTFTDI